MTPRGSRLIVSARAQRGTGAGSLAFTSNPDGTGEIEPLAQFITIPDARIVNAVGPIRQIVSAVALDRDERRYLAVMTFENGKPGPAPPLEVRHEASWPLRPANRISIAAGPL